MPNTGLLHGKAGIALYFYHLSRIYENAYFKKYAFKLIFDAIQSLSFRMPLDFENGQAGIGWAVEYLIQNKFIEANADDILGNTDDKIYKTFTNYENNIGTVISVAYYLIIRVHHRTECNNEFVVLLKYYIIVLIDELERLINKGETRYDLGYILDQLHKLNIFNYKIEKLQKTVRMSSDIGFIIPGVPKYNRCMAELTDGQEIYSMLDNYGIPDSQKMGLVKGIAGIAFKSLLNKSDLVYITELSVSILIPFYKNTDSFRKSFTENIDYFTQKGVELIICLNNAEEKDELTGFISSFPQLKCTIILNSDLAYDVLNAGVRKAAREHIMILNPETWLQSDIITTYSKCLEYYPYSFVTGRNKFNICDSLMVLKNRISEILIEPNVEYVNLRTRLRSFGLSEVSLPVEKESCQEQYIIESASLEPLYINVNNWKTLNTVVYEIYDTAVIIPVRIDSDERASSLDKLVKLLSTLKGLEVMIIESDKTRKVPEYKDIKYIFIKDDSPLFYRTRLANIAISKTERKYIGIWDADVITDTGRLQESMQILRENRADVVIPYDGRVVNMMNENDTEGTLMFGNHSVGGIFFISKKAYWKAGGENEFIVGWGPEDIERVKRWEIMEYSIVRLDGVLFHYEHPRVTDNYSKSLKRRSKNMSEFLKICKMDKETLQKHIQCNMHTDFYTDNK